MKRTYRITVFLDIATDDDSDEDFKDTVKDALRSALDQDDGGEEEINFDFEETTEEA